MKHPVNWITKKSEERTEWYKNVFIIWFENSDRRQTTGSDDVSRVEHGTCERSHWIMRIYRWAVSCCYEQNIYSEMKLFPSVSSSECQSVFYTRTRTIAQHMVCVLSAHRKYRRKEFYVGEFDLIWFSTQRSIRIRYTRIPNARSNLRNLQKIHKLFLLVFLLLCIFWKWKKTAHILPHKQRSVSFADWKLRKRKSPNIRTK